MGKKCHSGEGACLRNVLQIQRLMLTTVLPNVARYRKIIVLLLKTVLATEKKEQIVIKEKEGVTQVRR